MTTPNLTVIIPCNHGKLDFFKVINAICAQTIHPSEIIVINSSAEVDRFVCDVKNQCEFSGIKLIYVYQELALPGLARNIGLSLSKSSLIAFLDVQTIPKPQWIETALNILSNERISGVIGSTCFIANTSFEKLVRDAFFGSLPRKTLPGSVFRSDVFVKSGHFIDWVRAGEDTDWLLRLELLHVSIADFSVCMIDYYGLIGINLNVMLKKWHRNYTAAQNLPHLYPQKLFLWLVLYPLLIFVAFNWNYLIANWRMDSSLYIGHITKIAAILPVVAYLFARGILLPIQRGVGFFNLFPIRFLLIALITFMADAIKAFVFSTPKLKNNRLLNR